MNENEILSKITELLHNAAAILSAWLKKRLHRITDNWWEECVLAQLTNGQYAIAQSRNITKLEEFDLAALLRITDKNWYALSNTEYLTGKERDCIRKMQAVRNNWAHCSEILPGKDTIIDDLSTILEFYEQHNCAHNVAAEIEYLISEVQKADLKNTNTEVPDRNSESVSQRQQEIKEKDTVYMVADPSKIGIILSITHLGDDTSYEVFVNGEVNTYYTGQIALKDKGDKRIWTDISTFKSFLSAYQLNNPSSLNLYSLNSARIDFVPYQFRPALKIIKSDQPRILIADSVGVGKTIEAGLIIKELEARGNLERVLIICPKALVAERKWEMEMKRFDEEFIPINGNDLRQIISDTERDGEWPLRYSKAIIPYSILDSSAYQGNGKKQSALGLKNLDPAPHFDLVIVDEAHHIRNGSMAKDKAYAYKCVKYFCDNSDAVVMLTATPIQNSDNDLYTLLNVLRPDIIIDKDTFDVMSKPNAYVTSCMHYLRSPDDGWQQYALTAIEGVSNTQWGEEVIVKNPIYKEITSKLAGDALSREQRLELIGQTEKLHSFDNIINRTRRKDIQDFCIRRSHTVEVPFTAVQERLHHELLAFESMALATLHDARTVPFMISTLRRQAASSIYGLAPFIRDIVDRRFTQLGDNPEYDTDDFNPSNAITSELGRMAKNLLQLADNLPEEDPKFNAVLDVITRKQEDENNKIILFSTFRYTLAYVRKKLISAGVRVAQIDGSVKDEERRALRNRFRMDKNNSDAIDVLLFTEVGSEGLDYQFCNTMINYDLPWNPMRIEQRIGRIDRRGQKSEAVNIYNIITEGTVDADIYYRCLMRIGVFERSIGDCEEILGEISSNIEQIVLDNNLTDEERRLKLEKIADNEILRVQELSKLEDEEKGLFGFDLSTFTTSKEIQAAENPWITPSAIQFLVCRYLNDRIGGGTYFQGNGELKSLRLSLQARSVLKEDYNKLPGSRTVVRRQWEKYLKGKTPSIQVTFDQDAASDNPQAQFITGVHPLVKQAAAYFRQTKPVYVAFKCFRDDIPAGTYYFRVYLWKYYGENAKSRIQVVCGDERVMSEWNELVMSALPVDNVERYVSNEAWESLEKKHMAMWKAEKSRHIQDVKAVTELHISSIKNSYNTKLRNLQQRIGDTTEESLLRMYQSQYDSCVEELSVKTAELHKKEESADIEFTLIANGVVIIN